MSAEVVETYFTKTSDGKYILNRSAIDSDPELAGAQTVEELKEKLAAKEAGGNNNTTPTAPTPEPDPTPEPKTATEAASTIANKLTAYLTTSQINMYAKIYSKYIQSSGWIQMEKSDSRNAQHRKYMIISKIKL